jgi:hypothetical protein
MKATNIYPFNLPPVDNGHFVSSNELGLKLWRSRPETTAPKQMYYAIGLEVTGPTSVRIQVYGMADSVYGGVGNIEFVYKPTTLNLDDQKALNKHILNRQTQFAEREFQRREDERKAAQIEAIRKELFEGQP